MSLTEKEIKLDLLNSKNFQYIFNYLKYKKEPNIQSNYFFDTESALFRRKKLALRIRKENKRYFLTVKGKKTVKNNITTRLEIESEINSKEAKLIIENKKSILTAKVKPIHWIKENFNFENHFKIFNFVHFKNFRTYIDIFIENKKYIIELDKSIYANKYKRYELEVEVNDKYHSIKIISFLKLMFKDIGLSWKLSNHSKFYYALKYMGE